MEFKFFFFYLAKQTQDEDNKRVKFAGRGKFPEMGLFISCSLIISNTVHDDKGRNVHSLYSSTV